MEFTKPIGLLIGHSHLQCFGVPWRTEDGTVTSTAASPDFACLAGSAPRQATYFDKVQALSANHTIFIFWRGSDHIQHHLFESDPPIDFVLSGEPTLPVRSGAQLVPEQMLREQFASNYSDLHLFLQRLAAAAARGVVVCGTPPPKNDPALLKLLLAKPFFAELMAERGITADLIRLTPPQTLFKMWRLVQNMMREAADGHGLPFEPFPSVAQTEEGFLRQEYWADDITHANTRLGRLLLARLRQHLPR